MSTNSLIIDFKIVEKDKDILKELNELAPNLSKLPKKEQGNVPYNYFETLPEKVFERIRKQNKAPKWVQIFASLWQPKLIPAYAMAVIIGFGIFWIANQGATTVCDLDCELAQIDENVLNEYVIAHLDDFDYNIIETSYNLSGSEEVLYLDTDNETIENYLIEEMSDLEYDGIIL